MTHNPDRRIGAESEGDACDAEAVERVARALARYDGIEICNDATYRLSSYGPKAKAAIEALATPTVDAPDGGGLRALLADPTPAMWDAAWDASEDYFVADDISKRGLEAALKAFVRAALAQREGGQGDA